MAVSARLPYASVARMSATFRDATGALVDPTAVLIRWVDPQGNITSWTYLSVGSIVRDSIGKFHADVDTTTNGNVAGPGTWKGRWWSTGTGQASIDFQFLVDDSPLK